MIDVLKVKELKEALVAALEWIDAVPSDMSLPAMPGFDRDWVDGLLEEFKIEDLEMKGK